MSLVPNLIHLENGASNINLQIGGGGQNSLVSTDSFKVEASQTLVMKAYDANLNLGGNFGVGNADGTQIYRLPNPNVQFPTQSQVMVFASDGTSTFETLAIPENVAYNPAQANQNMAQYNVSNIAVLSVEKPVAAGQDQTKASLEVVLNEAKFTSETGIGGFTFDKPVSAPDMSSLTYSLEAVGAESSANASDVSTLQSQVASLITIIFNLTGIQV